MEKYALYLSTEELCYVERAIEVYSGQVRDYIAEGHQSAVDVRVYESILRRVKGAIGRPSLDETDENAPKS